MAPSGGVASTCTPAPVEADFISGKLGKELRRELICASGRHDLDAVGKIAMKDEVGQSAFRAGQAVSVDQ